jgi:nucleotide-binding universal stress UspA family protein
MFPFKKIVCATDFSDASYEALQTSVDMAAYMNAEIFVVHIVPKMHGIPPDPLYAFEGPEEYERLLKADAEQQLQKIIEQRVPKDIPSQTIISQEEAAEGILRVAGEVGAEVIVIATHGRTGWRHLVFGSVAERVIREAHCPVLVIQASKTPVTQP